MAGLTSDGFETKRFTEIITELRNQAQTIFGDLVEPGDTLDTSENTAIGRMIGLVTPSLADLWEAGQDLYDSFNPATAEGIQLDNLVALSGITRLGARPTIVQCIVEGTFGTTIGLLSKARSVSSQQTYSPLNSITLNANSTVGVGISVLTLQASTPYTIRYTTDGGVNYTTFTITSDASPTAQEILDSLESFVNANGGGVTVAEQRDGLLFVSRSDPFQVVSFEVSENILINKSIKIGPFACDITGAIVEEANSITSIAVPTSGWDSVYNPIRGETGRLREEDPELRERFRNTKFSLASNILESIIDGIASVEGVEKVVVYENDTEVTDSLGVPAHSFMPIVFGGLSTEIGRAIWENKPTGIMSFGDTTVQITDSQGILHNISFKIPTPIRLYVSLDITTYAGFPGEGEVQIKQAIIDYMKANYSIGDDIIYTRLYTPINSIAGHQINSLTIGTSPSPVGMSNISIDFDEIHTISLDDIIITS